jgi:hypothetical protein
MSVLKNFQDELKQVDLKDQMLVDIIAQLMAIKNKYQEHSGGNDNSFNVIFQDFCNSLEHLNRGKNSNAPRWLENIKACTEDAESYK